MNELDAMGKVVGLSSQQVIQKLKDYAINDHRARYFYENGMNELLSHLSVGARSNDNWTAIQKRTQWNDKTGGRFDVIEATVRSNNLGQGERRMQVLGLTFTQTDFHLMKQVT